MKHPRGSPKDYCPLCAVLVAVPLCIWDEGGRRWHLKCAARVLAVMPARALGDQVEPRVH